MIEDIIKTSSNPGDTVLDPFAGSFIVADCAQELDRHYIGIDSNRDYYAYAVEKITPHVTTKLR